MVLLRSGGRSLPQVNTSLPKAFLSSRERLPPRPRITPHRNCFFEGQFWIWDRPLSTVPTMVVSTTISWLRTYSSALKNRSSIHELRFILRPSSCVLSQRVTSLLTSTSSSLRKIMPIRETVAGEAKLRSCVSNKKLTLSPKAMRSPFGIVRRWLSSRTEFRLSIHSGSTSPSQTIQVLISAGSLTARRAASVKTPSFHSLVSKSILPRSCCLGMALGFMTWVMTGWPHLTIAAFKTLQRVVFPHPLGPTMTHPMRWSSASLSCSIFLTWESSTERRKGFSTMTWRMAFSSSPPSTSADLTPTKMSPMSERKLMVSL
mmetsp:Transcript_13245/g.24324  ORF Transcript_13245/g.24324 Transcript_13245/m.24324 type:complete len:317 (-) Transcript_13245:5787-6737(-)